MYEPLAFWTVGISTGASFSRNISKIVQVSSTYDDPNTEQDETQTQNYDMPFMVNKYQGSLNFNVHQSFDMFGYGSIAVDVMMNFGVVHATVNAETQEFVLPKGHEITYMFSIGYQYRLDRLVEHVAQLFNL